MGGAVLQIIPRQALNYEAGRFFEVYHSSRESFTFLKHFYVGEIRPEDLNDVPLPPPPGGNDSDSDGESEDEEEDKEGRGVAAETSVAASEEFLAALRECTAPFRLRRLPETFKSF